MALLFGAVTGFILLVVIIFYILKLCSITLFYIPGFENVFQFIIIIIPYVIFFCGYYYMHTKISNAKTTTAQLSGRVLMVFGSLVCFASMIMAILVFLKVKSEWVATFNTNSHYAFIAQILFLFATAAMIATGDAKEKNWMEREEGNV
jgi:glucan phosphoethanolaminetransferase (alkaline phosphatase superfamily)